MTKRVKKQVKVHDKEDQMEIQMDLSSFDFDRFEIEGYKLAMELGRKLFLKSLENMDKKLFEERPENWIPEGREKRTVVTKRLGEFTIWRHAYKDEEGKRRFLLDEHIELSSCGEESPELDKAKDILLKGILSKFQ